MQTLSILLLLGVLNSAIALSQIKFLQVVLSNQCKCGTYSYYITVVYALVTIIVSSAVAFICAKGSNKALKHPAYNTLIYLSYAVTTAYIVVAWFLVPRFLNEDCECKSANIELVRTAVNSSVVLLKSMSWIMILVLIGLILLWLKRSDIRNT